MLEITTCKEQQDLSGGVGKDCIKLWPSGPWGKICNNGKSSTDKDQNLTINPQFLAYLSTSVALYVYYVPGVRMQK